MNSQSLLEQSTDEVKTEIGEVAEAQRMLEVFANTPPMRDLRRRMQYFTPLISEREYNQFLQLAWDLLSHQDEGVWRVGDTLLHSLIPYKLTQREYSGKERNPAK